ncbi:MAG: hypothetical protein ACOH1T_00355 [Microbacteriaceae bacterium]
MTDELPPAARDRETLRSAATATARRRRGFSWALAAPLIGIVVIVAALLFAFASGLFSPAAPDTTPTSEPVPEITETPAPPSTRDSPAPAKTTLTVSNDSGPMYDVTFGTAKLNANDVIRTETRYYRDPDAGYQYLLIPVRFTYLGTTSGTPRIDLGFAYLATTGKTYEGTSSAVMTPAPIENIVKMQPAQSKNADIVIMVPTKNVAAGCIIVTAPNGTEYVVRVE